MNTEHAYALPECRNLFYGGRFHVPQGGYGRTLNPATQEDLGPVSNANAADVDAAVQAAHLAFQSWRHTKPAFRAAALREFASSLCVTPSASKSARSTYQLPPRIPSWAMPG